MKTVSVLLVLAWASPAFGQDIIQRPEGELYPGVEYLGGDATQPRKRFGALLLTDSTISLHKCKLQNCQAQYGEVDYERTAYFTIALRTLRDVSSVSQVRGPSATSRIAFGLLAGDRTEEMLGVVYQSEADAEAPVFQLRKATSGALEAKIRFRLEKLGVTLRPRAP